METVFEVALDPMPHILDFLIAMLPARIKYATLLLRTGALQGRRNLMAEAILVLVGGVLSEEILRRAWPLRPALFDPSRSM